MKSKYINFNTSYHLKNATYDTTKKEKRISKHFYDVSESEN